MAKKNIKFDLISNQLIVDSNQNNRKEDKILCIHCKRTIENGIRCMGICVADNEY